MTADCRSIRPRLALTAALVVTMSTAAIHAGQNPIRDVIDAQVEAAWKQQKITPAPLASDAVFLRRVYLDLVGTIPTHDQAKAFLDDTSADKRSKLIDNLLDDPRYAQHQADVWDMVLFGRNPPGYDARQRDGFQNWLREQFKANTPWDKTVLAMLKAEGNTVEQGAPMFLVQYRRKPADAVQAIVQRFLGVQLQCARCHDHPYEQWKQIEFYGMAAFLARLDVVEVGKKGKEKKLVVGEHSTGDIEFTGPAGKQEAGKKGEPVKPRFLAGDVLEEPALPEGFEKIKFKNGKAPPKPKFSRKDKLAEWVASPANPYFARAAANRVWSQFMGRGLVQPVDDMSADNKPTHPKLLAALTEALKAHQFDLKWYIRELCNSKAYQRAETGDVEAASPQWYERARVRPLSAEELAEAWRTATGYVATDAKAEKELEKSRFYPLTSGYVLSFFGEPTTGEGYFQGGLHEHLFMNNGGMGRVMTRSKGGLFDTIVKSKQPWEQRVDRLFVSILTRLPSPAEREKLVAYLTADERPDDRLYEAMWALMTCSEFRFNH